MGNCSTRAAIRRQEEQFEQTSTFVRFAMLGDLPNLKNMLAKDKMDPNARDVRLSLCVYVDERKADGLDESCVLLQRFGMTALHWGAHLRSLLGTTS